MCGYIKCMLSSHYACTIIVNYVIKFLAQIKNFTNLKKIKKC